MFRLAALLAVFALSFAFWVVVVASLGRAGYPARLLLSESCYRPQYELSRQLLALDGDLEGKVLVAGSVRFVDRIVREIPDGFDPLGIRIPAADPIDYGNAMRLLSARGVDRAIVQNAPRFWTNFEDTSSFGDQVLAPADLFGPYRRTSGIFADALATLGATMALVRTPCIEDGGNVPLARSFLWAQMLPADERGEILRSYSVALRRAEREVRVLWVFDPATIPEDALPETRAALMDFAGRNREVKGIGHFTLSSDPDFDVLR